MRDFIPPVALIELLASGPVYYKIFLQKLFSTCNFAKTITTSPRPCNGDLDSICPKRKYAPLRNKTHFRLIRRMNCVGFKLMN